MGGGVEEVKTRGAGKGTDEELVFTECECLDSTCDLLLWPILT